MVRGVGDIFKAIQSFVQSPPLKRKGNKAANHRVRKNAERWITLSACQSDQVNIEMKNPAVGKLTYAIYKKAKEIGSNGNADFFRSIRMFVNSNTGSRPQYPVMTGETDRYSITEIIR